MFLLDQAGSLKNHMKSGLICWTVKEFRILSPNQQEATALRVTYHNSPTHPTPSWRRKVNAELCLLKVYRFDLSPDEDISKPVSQGLAPPLLCIV